MRRELSIVGGIYLENCIQPLWNAVYGSAGRAAQAVSTLLVQPARLYGYISDAMLPEAERLAADCNTIFSPTIAKHSIRFDYLHPLSTPAIRPSVSNIVQNAPITVQGEVVLRYGMLEGDAVVNANIAVFDPQSAFAVPRFADNGSRADRLALVMNGREANMMTGTSNAKEAANSLFESGAEVVIVKQGAHGALVRTNAGFAAVPLYPTDRVWKIGSGDVFSAVFAALWGCRDVDPVEAANLASRATAFYCNTRTLPVPSVEDLLAKDVSPHSPGKGSIYLAGPFFDLGQRWLVEEARTLLLSMGAEVFSPVHEVGPGPAAIVAPEDIKGLEGSAVVLALLNGLDTGTVFEIGYAIKCGKRVVVLAQNLKEEDLTMIVGSGCEVVDDFATAIYRTLWALPAE